ncbi:MAG: DUF2726 domain-containing protein [Burkholderiaceae bacterium]|jgi:hypothetical protein|nr:DUF2726 domain-containing protein [Burkholderiaceae bacterium]
MVSTPVAIFLGAIAVLALLLAWKFVTAKPKPRRFRYQPCVAITPLQTQALLYLQTAFSEAVVLPQRPLANLLVARHVQAPDAALQARQALDGMKVDFAVCDDSGKTRYVFDLDPSSAAPESAATQLRNAEKNRILKSAGVRLILLKGNPSQWPTPAEFRLKLALAALPTHGPEGESEKYVLAPGQSSQASLSPESSIMGMTVLMTLEGEEAETAWRAARE